MKNLAKAILNYYATYTETGFRFSGSSKYKWSDTELCLDLSVFDTFFSDILESFKSGTHDPIKIKKSTESVPFDTTLLKKNILEIIGNKFTVSYLQKCIQDKEKEYRESNRIFAVSQDGKAARTEFSQKDTQKIYSAAIEQYAISLKEYVKTVLLQVSDETKKSLQKTKQISSFPSSSFSLATVLTNIQKDIIHLGDDQCDPEKFIDSVKSYFSTEQKLTLFDLKFSLSSYMPFMRTGSSPATYLYFHSIGTDKEKYPLFFTEINIDVQGDDVVLSFPRDFMYINTQAINHFELGDVLTLPRSFSIKEASSYIYALQHYLQVRFKSNDNFIFEPSFSPLVSDTEIPITISSKIGICTVADEDRKLLDYSEILSNVEAGVEKNFTTFIDQCITGNKPNYQEEVDSDFISKYPIQSPKRFYSQNPLPLNDSQKRILLALEKAEDKIIVVDGPPGTGKSHTIAAITYWANEKKKSIVLTSYKEQALDVLERMLEDKFSSIHPNIKPTILRFSQQTTSENTLHQKMQPASINSANDRTLEFSKNSVEKDIEQKEKEVEASLSDTLSNASTYKDVVKALVTYEESKQKLISSEHIPEETFADTDTDRNEHIDLQLLRSAKELASLQHITLDELIFGLNTSHDISSLLEACEEYSMYEKKLPSGVDATVMIHEVPSSVRADIEYLVEHIEGNINLKDIQPEKHKKGSFIGKMFAKVDGVRISNTREMLQSLKGQEVISTLSRLVQKSPSDMKVSDLQSSLTTYDIVVSMQKAQIVFHPYTVAIYDTLKKIQKLPHADELRTAVSKMQRLCKRYSSLFAASHIDTTDVGMLFTLFTSETPSDLVHFIGANEKLRLQTKHTGHTVEQLKAEYALSRQKLLEYENATRFKTLNSHLNDISKIIKNYDAGQRFTHEHTKVLLDAFSCIISEPNLISRYFPMEEELIDVLVIDEASQVSIADALSLILRAKQVVIFGDEYQYGAVKATNAATLYTSGYYKEIVDAFTKDTSTKISAADAKALIDRSVTEKSEDDEEIFTLPARDNHNELMWLEVFKIRVSALVFCRALANYSASLKEHFRSYPEIISYSNEFFYKKNQLELIPNRIRTKPIKEVLVFMPVKTKGLSGKNINFDEIEAIAADLKKRLDAGYTGTIGIITSFREQQRKMEEYIHEHFDFHSLVKKHKLSVWFVRDVQGEERDLVYYSFVQDDAFPNAELSTIYPVPNGSADSERSLKMQQLNVGFSRAKDTMIFVHSMPLEKYSKSRLGDALQHYHKVLDDTYAIEKDMTVDESAFESPMEKEMYMLITNTAFFKQHKDQLRMIPQFEIGKYIKAEYQKYIPKYRADLLVALTVSGKEYPLIVEYDGVEYHFKHPSDVDKYSFSQDYIAYDVARQLELESYGYRFLRLNKFILEPRKDIGSKVDIMNTLLSDSFSHLLERN